MNGKEHYEMMKALMGHVPDSIYFKDIEGKFVLVSRAKASNSGVKVEDMIGKTDFDFLPLEEAERAYLDEQNVIDSGKPIRDRVEKLTRQDGSEAWVSVTKAPWIDNNGKIIGTFGISRDITKRIESEKHLLNMVSIASHDIRGPLVSIGSTIKLLGRGVFGQVDTSVKMTLNDLFVRVTSLTKIVNDYLSKSSIIHAEIPGKEKLDLREDIIDPILDEFSVDFQENHITVDSSLGAIPGKRILIEANKNWLRIVYRNLISNAIKYGGRGCTIAFGFEETGFHYKLNVYNSGPAVPEEERSRIFEKFYSSENKGFGIGLWIIRDLIRKHRGEMWYESPNKDSNFVFTIPKEVK